MALWKARSLSLEQKVRIIEEESESKNLQIAEEDSIVKGLQATDEDSESKSLQTEESGSFLDVEDVSMSLVYSSVLSVPVSFCPSLSQYKFHSLSCKNLFVGNFQASFFMELFGDSDLDRRVMERAGCLNYSHSPWESEKLDVYQRQLYYKFDKRISRYRGEVTSTQQKSRNPDRNGWLVEEVMTLHGVPLGDYFNVRTLPHFLFIVYLVKSALIFRSFSWLVSPYVKLMRVLQLHLRYHVEDTSGRSTGCSVQVYFGMAWLKYTRHQKRITKNILSNLLERLLVMFSVLEKEFVNRKIDER